jgi:hypothetical protein
MVIFGRYAHFRMGVTCHGTLRALSTWSRMSHSGVTAHCDTVIHRYSKCITDDGSGYPYVAVHTVIQHTELSEIQSARSYVPTFMVLRYPGSTTILLQYCTVLTVKMCCNTPCNERVCVLQYFTMHHMFRAFGDQFPI